jgi:hypothetical protein
MRLFCLLVSPTAASSARTGRRRPGHGGGSFIEYPTFFIALGGITVNTPEGWISLHHGAVPYWTVQYGGSQQQQCSAEQCSVLKFEDHRSSSSSSSQNCQCHTGSGISSSSAAAAAAASSARKVLLRGLLLVCCVCFAFALLSNHLNQVRSGLLLRLITRPKSRTIMLCRFCFCSLKLIDHGSITTLNASDLAFSNGGLLGDASAVGRSALLFKLGRSRQVPSASSVYSRAAWAPARTATSAKPEANSHGPLYTPPRGASGSGARSPRQSPTHLH